VTGPVVMQPRCLYCGAEHYGPAVADISHGRAGCGRCGRIPPTFTSEDAYRQARRDHFHNDHRWVDQ
jgi:hypothetical protein